MVVVDQVHESISPQADGDRSDITASASHRAELERQRCMTPDAQVESGGPP